MRAAMFSVPVMKFWVYAYRHLFWRLRSQCHGIPWAKRQYTKWWNNFGPRSKRFESEATLRIGRKDIGVCNSKKLTHLPWYNVELSCSVVNKNWPRGQLLKQELYLIIVCDKWTQLIQFYVQIHHGWPPVVTYPPKFIPPHYCKRTVFRMCGPG
jgi:hypothetical protein